MKVVILAGGYGTRLSEETALRPKPMVEIGGKPILWHIMKLYSAFGINEFIICCGYKGFIIKEYFANYALHLSDVTFDLTNRTAQFHSNASEPWKVTLVDTGSDTQTGGRIKRIQKYIADETFLVTYGDGIGDVNIP
jgi:glucose-1-phosphate cytidylyltransferase